MANLNKVLANKDLKDNLLGTSEKVRTAATHINFAALQISQMLDKRSPLLHMIVGRPGHIETVNQGLEVQQQNDKKATELIKKGKADPENPTPAPASVPGGDKNPDKNSEKPSSQEPSKE
jgi:hypothetical protein